MTSRKQHIVDDTNLSKIIPNDDVSHMEAFLLDIIRWSQDNLMRVNWNKTKEMLLGPTIAKQQIKVLKRSSVSATDMLHFYKTTIIPVLC